MKTTTAALTIFATVCSVSTPLAFAQSVLHNQNSSPTVPSENIVASNAPFYKNMLDGARASVSTWQIPVFALSLLTERQKPGNGLSLPPLPVDHEIAEDLSRRDGRSSLGSISPEYYPLLAAGSRLAGMALVDMVTRQDYSPSSYAKLFRFQHALYFNTVVTHLAKRNFNRYRPDGSDTQSFFSGHASTAFATSTFLYLETRDFIDGQAQRGHHLPLLSSGQWKTVSFGVLYGWAAYVGYSRIRDNKHYLSDVLVGAASGTLVSYLLYPHQEKNAASSKMKFGIVPMPRGTAMGLSYNF